MNMQELNLHVVLKKSRHRFNILIIFDGMLLYMSKLLWNESKTWGISIANGGREEESKHT